MANIRHINYFSIPCIKTSDLIEGFDKTSDLDDIMNAIPEKFRNIKVNPEFKIILSSEEDFTNAFICKYFSSRACPMI